jgi:hypothetical protein
MDLVYPVVGHGPISTTSALLEKPQEFPGVLSPGIEEK